MERATNGDLHPVYLPNLGTSRDRVQERCRVSHSYSSIICVVLRREPQSWALHTSLIVLMMLSAVGSGAKLYTYFSAHDPTACYCCLSSMHVALSERERPSPSTLHAAQGLHCVKSDALCLPAQMRPTTQFKATELERHRSHRHTHTLMFPQPLVLVLVRCVQCLTLTTRNCVSASHLRSRIWCDGQIMCAWT